MSKYAPTMHRNIHTGTVSYGNPANWTNPDEWEPVHVLSGDELRAAQAEAWLDAIEEAEGCGWLHDYAAKEMHARNPYKGDQ